MSRRVCSARLRFAPVAHGSSHWSFRRTGVCARGSRARGLAPGAIVRAMTEHVSRGFTGRRRETGDAARVPPGQYLTRDFPVLSAGPTPRTPLGQWTFTIDGAVDAARTWTWKEFLALPQETPTVDNHCVTKWSKLDTGWRGVTVDVLLQDVDTAAGYVTAWCDGGHTTNLALEDVTEGRAWVVHEYELDLPRWPGHRAGYEFASPGSED